ncbi:hypothetical protein BH09VER1_BH09VER1_48790 [soil metagenome]
MKYLVQSKTGGTLLVLLALACWFTSSRIIPRSFDGFFPATSSIAAFAFFFVGCFLPEYRDPRAFFGRRAALKVMAYFIWMAGSASDSIHLVRAFSESAPWVEPARVFGSILLAFASYYLALYLIRGFHAPVAYTDPAESPQNEPAAASSAFPRPAE